MLCERVTLTDQDDNIEWNTFGSRVYMSWARRRGRYVIELVANRRVRIECVSSGCLRIWVYLDEPCEEDCHVFTVWSARTGSGCWDFIMKKAQTLHTAEFYVVGDGTKPLL